jgi:DNA-binding IclR family transcriptional regulator
MNHTQDIHDATACLRQFQSSPEGCSADEIAMAEGIPLERCSALLERLERAAVIQLTDRPAGRFRLSEDVTALHVLHAVWAPQLPAVQVLFETTSSGVSFFERLSSGLWPKG